MALWFHVTGCTYGAWLPGDERSFRTRHHREHIAGDIDHPPPQGMYDERRDRAQALMRAAGRDPVRLSRAAQTLALGVMVEAIRYYGGEVRIACLDDHHFHLLIRLPDVPRDGNPWASKPTHFHAWAAAQHGDYLPMVRLIMGGAKRHAAQKLVRAGLIPPGGVWATRMHMRRICDEAHFREAVVYIAAHGEEGRGATVWKEAETVTLHPDEANYARAR